MTTTDLEQLVEIIGHYTHLVGDQGEQAAQAILDAGYVKAEKVWDGKIFNPGVCLNGKFTGKHAQVFVREVKE